MTSQEIRELQQAQFDRCCAQWQQAIDHKNDADNPRAAFIRRLQNGWKRGEPAVIADAAEEIALADGVVSSIGEGLRYVRAMRKKKAREDNEEEDPRRKWIASLGQQWQELHRKSA